MNLKTKTDKIQYRALGINKKIGEIESKEIFLKEKKFKLTYLYFYINNCERIRIEVKNKKLLEIILMVARQELIGCKETFNKELNKIIKQIKKNDKKN